MTKWEYNSFCMSEDEEFDKNILEELDRMGSSGWELVSNTERNGCYILLFKRELQV